MASLWRSLIIGAACAATAVGAVAVPGVAHADSAGATHSYEVRPGDSLYGIASRHGVAVSELLSLNDLAITSVILPGQRLALPADAASPSTPSTGGSASGSTHTVVGGDSLSGIASRYRVSMSSLLSVNDLEITSVIMPGQRLTLPSNATMPSTSAATPGGGSSPAPSGASHTVVSGDSLYAIAYRHGVSVSSLLSMNGLEITSVIQPGQRLALPAGAKAVAPTAPSGSGSTTTPSTLSHAVVSGDSLSGIASRYRVSLSSLLATNELALTSVIMPGQRLALPANATMPTTQPAPTKADQRVAAVLDYARAQLGKPYEFFTRGPDSFDCSGLVLAAYAQVGVSLIHYSAAQAHQGSAVDFEREPIRAGDLVFLKRRGSTIINHVGIAVSPTVWIQATGPGDAVRLGAMPSKASISAVRRFIG